MSVIALDEIGEEFDRLASLYSGGLRDIVTVNRSRIVWQASVVQQHAPPGSLVVDLGGGVVPFTALCAHMGFGAVVVDDFGDNTYDDSAEALKMLEREGVEVRSQDLFAGDFSLPEDIGMVTCHDSMEHWHNSPKDLLHNAYEALVPNGSIWIGVPNAANLRKRLTVPFGKAAWSTMQDWYEEPVFRGHVREPLVRDLEYISSDLGAGRHEIFGKNWIGYRHPKPAVRTVIPYVDGLLQKRPSLCSDIYLLKYKG